MPRRRGVRLVAALAVATPVAVATAAPASAPPFTVFAKAGPARTSSTAVLERVRVGPHPGFDRVVFEFRGETPAWSAGYLPRVIQDPTGRPLPLAGRAFLRVIFHGVRFDRPAASAPLVRRPRFATLLEVKEAGDFEAVASFGLGLRKRAGFRGLHLSRPGRIAIDVSH